MAPRDFEYLKGYIGRHLIDLFRDVFPSMTGRRSTR